MKKVLIVIFAMACLVCLLGVFASCDTNPDSGNGKTSGIGGDGGSSSAGNDDMVCYYEDESGTGRVRYLRIVDGKVTLRNDTIPKKEGYSFAGLYSADGVCYVERNGSPTDEVIDSSVVLYAHWTAADYTVIFYKDEDNRTDEGILSSMALKAGEKFTYPQAPQKAGYRFNGWFFFGGGNNQISLEATQKEGTVSGAFVSCAEDYTVSLVPIFKKVYTLHCYNGNQLIKNIELCVGDKIEFPEVNEAGKTVVGWMGYHISSSSDFTFSLTGAVFEQRHVESLQDLKVYPVTENARYTVQLNYNASNVAGYSGQAFITAPGTYSYGSTFSLNALSSSSIKKDTGSAYIKFWSLDPNAGPGDESKKITGNVRVDKNLVLYAVWAKYGSVTLKDEKHSTQETIRVEEGMTSQFPPLGDVAWWRFYGWYKTKAFTSADRVTELQYSLAGATLYARWEEIASYTISYYKGDTYLTNATYTQTSGRDLLWQDNPTGYTFQGWCTKPDCSDTPVIQLPADAYGDKVFYAKFTPKRSTVYLYNDDLTSFGNRSVAYDEIVTFSPPYKSGYEFVGWYTANEGGKCMTDKNGKLLTAYKEVTDTYLYARFELQKYTARFVCTRNGKTYYEKTIEYDVEDVMTLPTDLVIPEGYTFQGWYERAFENGLPQTTWREGLAEDIEYYANIQGKTITLKLYKGEGGDLIKTMNVVYGDAYSFPAFTYGGEFNCWYTYINSTKTVLCDKINGAPNDVWNDLSNSKDIYLEFWKDYTITYQGAHPNDASKTLESYVLSKGGVTSMLNGSTISLNIWTDFATYGYKFDGWYIDGKFYSSATSCTYTMTHKDIVVTFKYSRL